MQEFTPCLDESWPCYGAFLFCPSSISPIWFFLLLVFAHTPSHLCYSSSLLVDIASFRVESNTKVRNSLQVLPLKVCMCTSKPYKSHRVEWNASRVASQSRVFNLFDPSHYSTSPPYFPPLLSPLPYRQLLHFSIYVTLNVSKLH